MRHPSFLSISLLTLSSINVSLSFEIPQRSTGRGQPVHIPKNLPTTHRDATRRHRHLPRPSPRPLSTSSTEDHPDEELSASKKLKRKLNVEFGSIAIPAFIQLAAEPLAGLVDTAYLGRLGPEVLGGAGVAISAQYAVSKLYNDPLLRTSISLVAAQDGRSRADAAASDVTKEEEDLENSAAAKDLSVAVSSAILLALSVGIIQLMVYYLFASNIISGMGVSSSNSMWHSAFSYLKVRSLGTPAATLWLVTNGVFRGLGDTKTPLKYSLLFTLLNALLDPFFIFTLGFGASGAAAGTAIAQYIALVPLMLALNRKVKIDIWSQLPELGESLKQYLDAGVLVLFRTFGKVAAYAVCAREAALLGPVCAAAYNLTFQLGFATTQICEAVAVAVQTLLAREIADTSSSSLSSSYSPKLSSSLQTLKVSHLIRVSMLLGGIVATALSLGTYVQQDNILAGLTTSLDVRDCAKSFMPAVLVTQVLKGLAYPVNGIIMGGLDWKFTTVAMWMANIVCVSMIRTFKRSSDMGLSAMTLNKIWWALAAFMGTQVVTGLLRMGSHTGVWKVLKPESSKD